MTALVHVVAVAVLLVVPGLLPARALVRSRPVGVVVAPLLTGLGCTGAAIVSLVADTSFAVALLVVFAATSGASLVCLRRQGRREPEVAQVGWAQVAFMTAVAAVPLVAVRRPPVDWDARAIWLLHADWFRVGGAEAASAIGNPLFAVTHPDYPPLAPATMAGVWTLLGRDYEVGQLVVALLGMAATVAAAAAVCSVVAGTTARVRAVAAGALILGAYGMAGASATNGYVDLLWAAAFAAGAVWLLLGRASGDADTLGVVCLAAAMATKNEGMVAGVAVLALLVASRGWRRALPLVSPPLALVGAWLLTARALGAEGDLATTARFAELLSLDPEVVSRVRPTVAELWRRSGWEIVVAGCLTVVGTTVARRERARLVGTGPALLWASALFCLATVGVVYVVNPQEVSWYLASSAARTTMAPRLLLLVESLITVLVLTKWLAGRRAAHDPPRPPPPNGVDPGAHAGTAVAAAGGGP